MMIEPEKPITSDLIKRALYFYFRFKRNWLCADEASLNWAGIADMIVDTGKATYEVEIKISKSDLWNGEAKKIKHCGKYDRKINKFYMCVPKALLEEALKWVEAVNPKYGIIGFSWEGGNHGVWIYRQAKELCSGYSPLREKIAMRLCAKFASEHISKDFR